MDDIWKALDDLGAETKQSFSRLRADMKKGFEEQRRALNRAIRKQQHALDDGLAEMDVMFERHRENIGTIIHTCVEDVHGLKASMRSLETCVDRLEGKKAS